MLDAQAMHLQIIGHLAGAGSAAVENAATEEIGSQTEGVEHWKLGSSPGAKLPHTEFGDTLRRSSSRSALESEMAGHIEASSVTLAKKLPQEGWAFKSLTDTIIFTSCCVMGEEAARQR